jgi:hypothetical protein
VDQELQQQLTDRSQSSVVENPSEVWVLTLTTTITLWVIVEARWPPSTPEGFARAVQRDGRGRRCQAGWNTDRVLVGLERVLEEVSRCLLGRSST